MLKAASGSALVWPKRKSSSNGICNCVAKSPKYRFIISRGNASLPAGTGVCVVKTLAEATTCKAE